LAQLRRPLGLLSLTLLLFGYVVADESSAVRRGGTLNLVVGQASVFVRNFNPYVQNARQTSRWWMYEPLLIFNALKPGEYFPRLAEGFEQPQSLDYITVHLRKNLKWSDGRPLTVADVVFSVELLKRFPALDILGITALVESVEQVGANSLKFHLLTPNSTAIYKLAELMPLPEHIWSQVGNPLFYMNANPVGSGPFTEVVDFTPFVYKQCRNPHYWQAGKPYIDCLRNLQFSDNDQVIAAARRGEIDWMGTFIASPEQEYADYHPHNRYWQPAYEPVNIHLNTRKKPFDDLRFRQAFSLALNRKEMVEIAAYGLPIKSEFPIGIGVYYDSWINRERLAPYARWMKYDPQQAAAILDSAGYIDRDGNGWRELADGETITITLSAPAGWTDWTNVLATAVQNLRDIGLKARLSTPDEDAWYEMINAGEGDAVIMWAEIGTSPWHTYWTMFNPRGMNRGNIHLTQFHQYRFPEVVALLERFGRTQGLAEQKAIIAEVEELVAQRLPVIHLFSNPGWYQYNDSRFQGWSNRDNAYVRPYIQNDVPERLIHLLNLSLKKGVEAP